MQLRAFIPNHAHSFPTIPQYGTSHHSSQARQFYPHAGSPDPFRTDEHILDEVRDAFRDCGFEQLQRIQTYCDHGRITLQGRVSTHYLKQLAQEIARKVPNVRDIDNDLRVVSKG